MRIISGSRRGHQLHEFKGFDVRPTTDRVKESIFNLIQNHVPNANVLDMFGGSGALSFEALSRGAEFAVILDSDKRSVELIRKNMRDLRFDDVCEVREMSCFDYVRTCGKKFDLIFLDPPYNKGFIEPALTAISENELLSESGIVLLESDNTDFKNEFPGLLMEKQRRYGRTFVTVYKSAKDGE